jgi:hypothetical protein
MRYTGLIFVLCLLLTACEIKPGTAPAAEAITKPVAEVPDTLYSTQKLHAFSDPAKPDTFKLDVSGKDYLSARARIQIVSGAGVLIYLEEFNTADLAEYGIKKSEKDTIPPTEAEKVAHIRTRVKEFFDSKQFSNPAIKPGTALLSERITNQELVTELKTDPKSIAFHYILGLEDGVYIAYSEKLGKAVLFYTGVLKKDN